ncbi:hypothetical protein [Chondromyces crocatus]|uniref:Uncharacterized protein n=1 Tax=Chondromyces crocatus TaxID=52 RepID=A0A0K1EES1_CHOCO|nr:hypothetical protein [Chondromyces crocatus]AKT39371.1 uncharacterized protein CMC5_035180 [Chondromyces crocatus]
MPPRRPTAFTLLSVALLLGPIAWSLLGEAPASAERNAARPASPSLDVERHAAPPPAPAQATSPSPRTDGLGSERSPEEAPDAEHEARVAIRQAAWQYRAGRQNIFFDEVAFLDALPLRDPRYLSRLRDELTRADELHALPSGTRFSTDRPAAIVERMAMLDLLAELAHRDDEAIEAMVDLLLAPIDGASSEVARKALVGERYDLLVALVQADRSAAFEAFTRIPHEGLRRLLKPALLKGLYELGLSVEAADAMTTHL